MGVLYYLNMMLVVIIIVFFVWFFLVEIFVKEDDFVPSLLIDVFLAILAIDFLALIVYFLYLCGHFVVWLFIG